MTKPAPGGGPTANHTVAIVVFDDFTDIDVFLPWDLLTRVDSPGWRVRLLGQGEHATSKAGLTIPLHGRLQETAEADAVIVASGPGARLMYRQPQFMAALRLDSGRQLIGAMCSGALILAAKGLLAGKRATTYPTSKALLEELGVEVVERAFVEEGRVATAAGCLAAQELCGWIIEALAGPGERRRVLASVQPVGAGLFFEPSEEAADPVRVLAPDPARDPTEETEETAA